MEQKGTTECDFGVKMGAIRTRYCALVLYPVDCLPLLFGPFQYTRLIAFSEIQAARSLLESSEN
jgi:hypothetical protein